MPKLKQPTLRRPSLGLATIKKWEPVMKARGVSVVARSSRGFLPALKRAKGSYHELQHQRNPRTGQPWPDVRRGFLARHLAQQRSEPLFVTRNGVECPTDRHLAMIAWDYSPAPGKLRRLNPKRCR